MRNIHKDPPTIAEDIAERIGRKRRTKASARHVRLYYALLESAAWAALTATEKIAYVEFCRIYNGGNNGRIVLSTRDVEKRLSCSKGTACRVLARLEEVGLTRKVKSGVYTYREQTRRAAEWRLTDFQCNVTGSGPTREWKRWKPDDRSTREAVPPHQESSTVPPGKHGYATVKPKPQQNGGGDRSTEPDDRSTREPHIELPDGMAGKQPAPASQPETGRSTSTITAHHDAQGKIPPSSSKQKKILAPHATRSAAAKPLNGSAAVKEQISVLIEKRRRRERREIERKIP